MKAEEKAKELYPIDNDMFINRFAKIENATRQAQQKAFLKGVEFAQQQNEQIQLESTNQDKVREAAEEVVVISEERWRKNCVGLMNAIDELEKALNQNK